MTDNVLQVARKAMSGEKYIVLGMNETKNEKNNDEHLYPQWGWKESEKWSNDKNMKMFHTTFLSKSLAQSVSYEKT